MEHIDRQRLFADGGNEALDIRHQTDDREREQQGDCIEREPPAPAPAVGQIFADVVIRPDPAEQKAPEVDLVVIEIAHRTGTREQQRAHDFQRDMVESPGQIFEIGDIAEIEEREKDDGALQNQKRAYVRAVAGDE